MFAKILLPVDLTERHQRAVEIAAALALQSGGEVVLLHVIEVISGMIQEEEQDFYGRLEGAARAHLHRLSMLLEHRKVRCRSELLYGKRAPEIVRYAATAAVDLIVLTSPRPDPTNPAAGWGSMSYKIGLTCQCPVLLVK
jgi:nucleotide-binding universal stress UspA family protein